MATLGIDLGRNVAAVRVEWIRGEYRCMYAEAWQYEGTDWGIEEAALWTADLLRHDLLPAMFDVDSVVIEEVWFHPVPGRATIDPNSVTPIVAQQGLVVDHVSAMCIPLQIVSATDVSRQTDITKGLAVGLMPSMVKGLDMKKFLGPRGGKQMLEHVADAAKLAYYGESRRRF